MRAQLRATILACGLILALLAASTRASAQSGPAPGPLPGLPEATNLAADGRASERDRVPILLFFSREDCPYCRRALAEYLVPMSGEPQWLGHVAFRQIEIDQALPLIGFDGRPTTHADLARRFAVRFTPTVIVVGPDGTPLARPIVGLPADFYLGYLEQAIQEATQALRRAPDVQPRQSAAKTALPRNAEAHPVRAPGAGGPVTGGTVG